MNKLSFLLCFYFFYFISSHSKAQGVGYTRGEIILKYGNNYKSGVSKSGDKYIAYIDNTSRTTKTFYLNEKDSCYMVMRLYPKSEANSVIKLLNEKYVKISDGVPIRYKDYESSLSLDVYFSEEFVTVEIHGD
ncbi:hypothetical protein [Hymenobacter sp. UYCo722]|uniref:hypothetical protein n=1 Tax=Hymenobacter sp. UYCo722 TaxID=3156335 RepID=UPI003397253A